LKPVNAASYEGIPLLWEVSFRRESDESPMELVVKRPLAEEVDDYKEYKRLRKVARIIARDAHHKRPHREDDIDLDPLASENKAKPAQESFAQPRRGDSMNQDSKIMFSNAMPVRSRQHADFGELQVPRLLPPVDADTQDLPPEAVRARLLSTAHLLTLPLPESIAWLAPGTEGARPSLHSKAMLPIPAVIGHAGPSAVHTTYGSLSGVRKGSIPKSPSISVLPLLKAAVFEDGPGAQARPAPSNITHRGPAMQSTKRSGPQFEAIKLGAVDFHGETVQQRDFAFSSPSLIDVGVQEAFDDHCSTAEPTQSAPKAKSQLFKRISGVFDGALEEHEIYVQLDGSERGVLVLRERRGSVESEASIPESAGRLISPEETRMLGDGLDDTLVDKNMLALSRRRSSSADGTVDACAKRSTFGDIEWLRARQKRSSEEAMALKS